MLIENAYNFKFDVKGEEYKFTIIAPTLPEAKKKLIENLEGIIEQIV